MEIDQLITDLNKYKPDAFDNLETLVATDPTEAHLVAMKCLQSPTLRNDGELAVFLMRILRTNADASSVDDFILKQWASGNEVMRARIVSSVFDALAVPTSLAIALFEHSSSTVMERHRITAGLAATLRVRQCKDVLGNLVGRIGRYDTDERQQVLDDFLVAVQEQLQGDKKKATK